MQLLSMASSESLDCLTDDPRRLANSGAAGGAYEAWSKSAQIILRSSPLWNSMVFGLAWMTTEEAFGAVRTRLSCTTVGSWAALERELAPRMLADTFARLCLLVTSAMQIGEEAGYPLQRWMVVQLEKLAPTLRA
jgi:hypothetical protein